MAGAGRSVAGAARGPGRLGARGRRRPRGRELAAHKRFSSETEIQVFSCDRTPRGSESSPPPWDIRCQYGSEYPNLASPVAEVRNGRAGGLGVLKADSEEEARALVGSDPAISSGMATFELGAMAVTIVPDKASMATFELGTTAVTIVPD